MGPFFVVTLQPVRTHFSHLVQRLEHIGIQYFGAIGPIEPLDETWRREKRDERACLVYLVGGILFVSLSETRATR
jgi:hypothetical protein